MSTQSTRHFQVSARSGSQTRRVAYRVRQKRQKDIEPEEKNSFAMKQIYDTGYISATSGAYRNSLFYNLI